MESVVIPWCYLTFGSAVTLGFGLVVCFNRMISKHRKSWFDHARVYLPSYARMLTRDRDWEQGYRDRGIGNFSKDPYPLVCKQF